MLTAQAIRSKRQIEIQNGEYEFTKQYKTDTPVLEYFRKMCEERHGNTESRGNWGNWYSCLKHLEGYCSEDTTFKEVDQDWIEGFKDYLNNVDKDTYKLRDGKINSRGRVSKPLSQNSKVSYFAKLRACMNKAYDDKIIPTNPIRNVENFKAEDVERVYLTLDEVRSLAQAECDYPILKRAFLFSCLTGIRKSDIERLTWGQVTKFGDFTRITFTQKKTTKLLYLDITEEAVSYMGERRGFNDLVFDGFKYSSQTLVELKRWCLKAGITKDVTFHSGRHTFAVLMITLGADI
jgi:integrase